MASDPKLDNGSKTEALDIPEILEGFLLEQGIDREDVFEIAFEDVEAEAYYILTKECLYKASAESGSLEEEIRLEAITKADIKSMVGGGVFELYLDRMFKEVARFSNTRMKSFGRISKLINEYIKNQEIKDEGEVDRDIACVTCKRPLPERDAICPFCLNKKKVLLRFLGFIKPYGMTAAMIFMLLMMGLFLQMIAPQLFRFILDDVLVGGGLRDESLEKLALTEKEVFDYAVADGGGQTHLVLAVDEYLRRLPEGAPGPDLTVALADITATRLDIGDDGGILVLIIGGSERELVSFSRRTQGAIEKFQGAVDRFIEGQGLKKRYKQSMIRSFILYVAGLFSRPMDNGKFRKEILLLAVVSIMVSRWLIQLVSDIVKGRTAARMGNALVKDLRSAIFDHLQKLSFSFYDKRRTGALMSRVAHDTERLQSFIMQAVFHFLPNIFILGIILVILLSMNWQLTLWVLIPAPIIFFGTLFCWKKFIALIHRYFGARARLGAEVNDAISGIRVIRAFGQEHKSVERFEKRNYEMFDSRVSFEQYIITVFTSLGHFTQVGFFLIYLLGGYMVIGKELSIGAFMAFTMYLGMFLPALRTLSHVGEWLSGSLAAAQRVFDVLDTEPEIISKDDGIDLKPLKGEVIFEEATFGYESFKPVIKNVDLKVEEGELIGLVGESGVGKTTMTNLICRFYDVPEDAGRILIDGIPIKDIKLSSLRGQIGIVLQEPFLFQGTVAENIAYPKPDATMDEIIAAAKAANAHDFIMKNNEGYETYVGERGGRLSGGEKQRISIARAILHDPRILILDEATSSVDSATEKKIQEALERLTKGRTTFAIAHRLSTLRKADRLVVLEKGEVAEIGTHEELIAKKGVFFKLVNLQKESTEIMQIGG